MVVLSKPPILTEKSAIGSNEYDAEVSNVGEDAVPFYLKNGFNFLQIENESTDTDSDSTQSYVLRPDVPEGINVS